MCFSYESDWTADVCEKLRLRVIHPTCCDECQRTMPTGTTMHHISLQQYAECHLCSEGECSCPEQGCCQCAKPVYGETFDYDRCDDCELFLDAIRDAEVEEGCHLSEAQPALEMMREEMREVGAEGSGKYFAKARAKHPHLDAYLDWLFHAVFDDREA